MTLWLTGLPCAGKTTIAQGLFEALRARGQAVELLDGDEIRKEFSAGVGFSREERCAHLRRVGFLCRLLTKHGVTVIAAFVSPYRETRDDARRMVGDGFAEIFVDTPLAECIRRDVKGMYRRALAGEIRQFTGISDPYEPPLAPELTLRTMEHSVEECVNQVLELTDSRMSLGRVGS